MIQGKTALTSLNYISLRDQIMKFFIIHRYQLDALNGTGEEKVDINDEDSEWASSQNYDSVDL